MPALMKIGTGMRLSQVSGRSLFVPEGKAGISDAAHRYFSAHLLFIEANEKSRLGEEGKMLYGNLTWALEKANDPNEALALATLACPPATMSRRAAFPGRPWRRSCRSALRCGR